MDRTWWWLSFADPDRPKGTQFLGVVVTEGMHFLDAVSSAHLLKLNPGGECEGREIPDALLPAEEWRNRLLKKDEAMQVARLMDRQSGVLN